MVARGLEKCPQATTATRLEFSLVADALTKRRSARRERNDAIMLEAIEENG